MDESPKTFGTPKFSALFNPAPNQDLVNDLTTPPIVINSSTPDKVFFAKFHRLRLRARSSKGLPKASSVTRLLPIRGQKSSRN